MRINFNQELIGFDGNILQDEKGSTASLKNICTQALLINEPNEMLDPVEKMKRFTLAQLIYKTSEFTELTVEDIVLLKKVVGKYMTTLVVGLVFPLLDTAEKNK